MSDLALFLAGVGVTTIAMSAVVLLCWAGQQDHEHTLEARREIAAGLRIRRSRTRESQSVPPAVAGRR